MVIKYKILKEDSQTKGTSWSNNDPSWDPKPLFLWQLELKRGKTLTKERTRSNGFANYSREYLSFMVSTRI